MTKDDREKSSHRSKALAEKREWDRFMGQFKEDPEKLERVRQAFRFLADFTKTL